jgi:predicted membrane-bound spermidine synthase
MDSNTSVSSFRIPIWVWVIVAAIVIGGIAIFGFNVPLTTVGTYGFFICKPKQS